MTKLAVFSYKDCWPSIGSPTGYSSDGGFPFQMRALSELFDATVLIVPCLSETRSSGEIPLEGHNLSIAPLTPLVGSGWRRKVRFMFWMVRNASTLVRELWRADAVHTPIPADVGTVGMLLAFLFRKPLFVRHCGNWLRPVTSAEHFWKWFMERFAGGRNLMLATGGAPTAPSQSNQNVRWIFSTSLSELELESCAVQRHLPGDSCLRLVIACRQDREKGTGVVIESLPLVLERFPKTTLDVLGDGPVLKELQNLTTNLHLNDRVRFHGKVNHQTVLKLLGQADIFCYPTRASEGFPKVVLEALACGIPVITTRVSVLPELLGSGAGLLIEEASPKALANAITQIASDPALYRTMSVRAIETAGQYSLEHWRDAIGKLLIACWGNSVTLRSRSIELEA